MWGCERKASKRNRDCCVCMYVIIIIIRGFFFFSFYGESGGHRFQFIVAYKIWDKWKYVTWQAFYIRFGYVINFLTQKKRLCDKFDGDFIWKNLCIQILE